MNLKSIILLAGGMLLMNTLFGQYYVTTGTTKYVLLEECTGTWCGYCPDGAQDIQEKITPVYPHCIVASWHGPNGYGDPMMVAGDPFAGSSGYFSGFPKASVDRVAFSGAVGLDRPWDPKVAIQNGVTAKFRVDMNTLYNGSARQLTVTVTGTALATLTGSWRINALVTEDSIGSGVSSAYNQDNYAGPPVNDYTISCTGTHSWFDGSGDPIMPAANYTHMNVVRAVLAAGGSIWGDAAFTNPSLGTTASQTYTYTLQADHVPQHIKVIGIVQKYGSATFDRAIENSIEWKLGLDSTLGARGISKAMMDVQLYPNPVKNNITVRGIMETPGATNVVIYNAPGQVVVKKDYETSGSLFMESISLEGFSNGLYFMSVIDNGQVVTRQFSINR